VSEKGESLPVSVSTDTSYPATQTNISDYSDPSEDSVSDNEEGNDEENDDMGAMFSDDGDAGYYIV